MGADITFLMVRDDDGPSLAERLGLRNANEMAQESERYYANYLQEISKQADGISVQTVIRTGDPAEEILKFEEERSAQIVIMASHGRSGLSRWRYGSVCDKIVHNSTVPVLIIGPRVLEEHRTTHIEHIAVPLDGSPEAEAALPFAIDLATSTGAQLSLIRSVRWAAQMYPYTMAQTYVPAYEEIDSGLEAEAKDYLEQVKNRITGVKTINTGVMRGIIVDSLVDYCEQKAVDFVVMTTRARGGLARATLGSVADRMINGPTPVLLIRPEE
jgi:nucleotide-binding universal stress UspA family protein